MEGAAAADVKRLIELQERIGKLVLETIQSAPREPPRPRLVAGLDAAYSRRYSAAVGVAAVLDYGSLTLRGYGAALGEPPLPYIPGLLAFREAPVLYTALRAAPGAPELLVVDGHGLGHPRLAGIASHIGLALGLPSIGVAKRRLYGVERVEDKGCEPPCV
ncbi:MAG: endonuclease V, partial [Crenarchaeota archaeon]|nr:endonuclease V [Thermoproteota archaeon]